MFKKISNYNFLNKYIENDFANKKEYYFLGFQSADYFITKVIYNYLINYNCEIKFCCDFNLVQKIVKKVSSKEYFENNINLDQKYIYSFIGAVICDNVLYVEQVINDIFKIENFLLTIYKKEENKYKLISEFNKKNNYSLTTNYSIEENNVICNLDVSELNLSFTSVSKTMIEAKYETLEQLSYYLSSNNLLQNIVDVIGNFSVENAVLKLEYLYNRGYIKKPNYIYIEHSEFDPVKHEVRCSIEDISFYSVKIHSVKEEAKNQAAYSMLEMIVIQNT